MYEHPMVVPAKAMSLRRYDEHLSRVMYVNRRHGSSVSEIQKPIICDLYTG